MAFPFAFSGFLAAMQAAGLITDYSNIRSRQRLLRAGQSIDNAQFDLNMENIKYESEQASLNEMRDLRKNIGTQIAAAAARGASAAPGVNEASFNFTQDERTRRMNLLSKESQLRAGKALSGLHTLQSETELGRQFASRALNTLPISQVGSMFGQTPLGQKWGFGQTKKNNPLAEYE
jgi:hypothetical protein